MYVHLRLRFSRVVLGCSRSTLLAVLALQAIMATGDINPDQLLKTAVDRVSENTRALRRLTCEERTARSYYLASSKSVASDTEASLYGNGPQNFLLPPLLTLSFHGRNLLWSDRLRIELSLFNGKDLFSWPGGEKFDSDLDNLVTDGATLSGVLGPFDVSVLMNDAEPKLFHYEGIVSAFGTGVAAYAYKVPVERSHLLIPDANGKRNAVAYRGFFLVDPSTGDLRRLCVELDQLPNNTPLELGAVATDYAPHSIADVVAFVPVTSTMRLLFKEGQLSVNDMKYADCHEFQAESTLHFKPVSEGGESTASKSIVQQLRPIPKDRVIKLALNTPIDSNTAAAGDPVEAHVTKPLKGKAGRVIVPAGTMARGGILRLIQYAPPFNSFDLVIRFEALEIGGESISVHISPAPTDASEPLPDLRSMGGQPRAINGQQRVSAPLVQGKSQLTNKDDDRKNGTGTLEFNYTNHLHLGVGYTTDWMID